MPQDKILILNRVIALHPLFHPLALLALVGEFARRKQLVILILGHPDRLGSELGPLVAKRPVPRQQHLARRGLQLIGHRFISDRVDAGVVADLEHPVALHAGVGAAAGLQDGLFGGVTHQIWVVLVLGHRHAILVVDRVFEPINGRVNTEGEHVLVERRHHARPDVRSPGYCRPELFVVKRHSGQNTGRAHLQLDVGRLVEDKGKDVLVVGHSADHLDH